MDCRPVRAFFSFFLLITVLLTCGYNSVAQNAQYNLSISNGLPSNHVYRTLIDKNGYLWIATDKGVAKYNGYSVKVFNALNGIANDDIWNLFEDYKGRIWLCSISNEIGYIYNDEYHKAILKEPTKFYPYEFINYPDGIILTTGDRMFIERLCIEKNDTISTYNLRNGNEGVFPRHMLNQELILLRVIQEKIERLVLHNSKLEYFKLKTAYHDSTYTLQYTSLNNYLIPTLKRPNDTALLIVDVKNDEAKYIHIDKEEELVTEVYHDNYYYFTTTKRINKFDKDLNLITSIITDSINKVLDEKIDPVTFVDDAFGNRYIATSNKGLLIEGPRNYIKKCDKAFIKDKYIGTYKDSLYFWWNTASKSLSIYNSRQCISSKSYANLRYVKKVIPLAKDKFILLSNESTFLLHNDILSYFFSPTARPYWMTKDSLVTLQKKASNIPSKIVNYIKLQDCIFSAEGTVHLVSMGFGYCVEYLKKDSTIIKLIDSGRYESIKYYRPLNSYIIQGKNQILIHHENDLVKIDAQKLLLLGITSIQKIAIDTLGNIFIKTPDQLLVYNPLLGKHTSLFKKYNLNNASIHLYKNKIVVAGRFGIAYQEIYPGMLFSKSISCINFKKFNYLYINDSYIVNSELIINTDKGGFSIDLNNTQPDEYGYNFSAPNKLYISSKNHKGIIAHADTLDLEQNEPDINFDFINPYGDGVVKYTYTIDDASSINWTLSDRINFPVFTPGIYYKMKLVVSDESWKSEEYIIYIKTLPYWWQTNTGKTWLFILSLLGLSAVSLVTILTTKHILNKRHTKENKYLELELRSIYAQLNPHFIFNTLSNIIYYIKKDKKTEAYTYLNTFSKLLRSYIKSSRNKWLPLNEEIENIENYIILQQSRFENKFDYIITVDTDIDTQNIQLPSLLLQPLVENAIHHGLQQKKEKGLLNLSFKKTNDINTIVIVIEDDGIGRIKAKEFSKNSLNKKESFGSDLIEDLVTIYKRYELFSIDIEYYDKSEPLSGTTVTLTIKHESQ
jgi:hypothetical protein